MSRNVLIGLVIAYIGLTVCCCALIHGSINQREEIDKLKKSSHVHNGNYFFAHAHTHSHIPVIPGE